MSPVAARSRPLHRLEWVVSLLFVPGHDRMRIAKAAHSDADAVVLDLEDGVTDAADKALARQHLSAAVACVRAQGKVAVVRVNHDLLHLGADLRACAEARPDAFMWPKAGAPEALGLVDRALHQLGADPDLACIALVEDPATVGSSRALRTLLDAPRVRALALGSEDFSAAMQAPPSADLLTPAVQALTLAARTRPDVRVYAMPHSIADLSGGAAWAGAAHRARALGADGALCVHPRQLAAVHQAFAVTAQERDWGRAVLQAVAAQPGQSVWVVHGRMVDAPVLARACHLLHRAGERADPSPPSLTGAS